MTENIKDAENQKYFSIDLNELEKDMKRLHCF